MQFFFQAAYQLVVSGNKGVHFQFLKKFYHFVPIITILYLKKIFKTEGNADRESGNGKNAVFIDYQSVANHFAKNFSRRRRRTPRKFHGDVRISQIRVF